MKSKFIRQPEYIEIPFQTVDYHCSHGCSIVLQRSSERPDFIARGECAHLIVWVKPAQQKTPAQPVKG